MTLRIGWYVHHHGGGHLARMLAIAPHVDAEIHCFSSLAEPAGLPAHCTWTVLDRDDDTRPGAADPKTAEPDARGLLHWAPLGHPGHLGRLSTIASAVAPAPVDAFVVDVSVEVTLLVRLLGVRPVVMAQPGVRDDLPHQLGYRAASAIIAPWPRAILNPSSLMDAADRTVFTGGISRFDGRSITAPVLPRPDRDGVVVLGGGGGSSVTSDDIVAAADASRRPWRVLGATAGSTWSSDPWDELTAASVVVAWAGQNSIADLAAAGAAAVILPQDRPFDEQRETARAIERAGLAIVCTRWPDADAWPELIERAERLEPDWSRWEVPGAAARAADAIIATARGR